MTTTEWFPATINPVHVGYYEVRYSWEDESDPRPSRYFWDGSKWQFREGLDGELSWGDKKYEDISDEYWRGLTERAA